MGYKVISSPYTKAEFDAKFRNLQNQIDNIDIPEEESFEGIVYGCEKVNLFDNKYKIEMYGSIPTQLTALQGMAIYEGIMFSLVHTGECFVYDITGASPVAVGNFSLGSAADTNHANCASFGLQKYSASDEFPCMYVARCYSGYRTCLVERVTRTSSTLVQTISIGTYAGEVNADSEIQWVAGDDGFLYMFGYTGSAYGVEGNKFVIAKFEMPSISAGDVALDLNDAIYMYYMEDYGETPGQVLQGCTIKNGQMILPIGNGTQTKKGELLVWSLGGRYMKARLDFSPYTTNEVEDASVYDGKVYARFLNGSIYTIAFA